MENYKHPHNIPKLKLVPFKDAESAISLYALLSVFRRMRNQLGLEVMLEYMDFYHTRIEKHNPQFQQAVGKALELINVEKIYEDAMRNGENKGPGSF